MEENIVGDIYFLKKWSRDMKETVQRKEARKSNKLWTLKYLWRISKTSFVDIASSNKNKCDILVLLLVLKLVVITMSCFNVNSEAPLQITPSEAEVLYN